MTKKELISKVEDLENEIEQLKQDYYFDIRNKNLEIYTLKQQLKALVYKVPSKYLTENKNTDEFRISQFNRNRAPEEQVSTIKELEVKIKELFKENNNG